MSQTQEIIVYRNPMEKAMWDTMSGGEYFPIMVAAVVFIAVFMLTAKGLERFVSSWDRHKKKWPTVVLWGIPAIAAIATIKAMII